MDYYSFFLIFKILRKLFYFIKRFIKKNKIKIIILLIILFLVLLKNNVFAVEWTDEEKQFILSTITDMQNNLTEISENEKQNNEYNEQFKNYINTLNANLEIIKNEVEGQKTTLDNIYKELRSCQHYLNFINNSLNDIETNTDNISLKVDNIDNSLTSLLELLQQNNSSLNDVNNSVNDVNTSVGNVNNSVNDVNNTLNNSDINADSSTLPTDNTTDITDAGFNDIFTMIYNALYSNEPKDLVLKIPFTDKSFIVNVKNVYGENYQKTLGMIYELIVAGWYFGICLFIVNDISKRINSIKSGNIENTVENNVKEDLL